MLSWHRGIRPSSPSLLWSTAATDCLPPASGACWPPANAPRSDGDNRGDLLVEQRRRVQHWAANPRWRRARAFRVPSRGWIGGYRLAAFSAGLPARCSAEALEGSVRRSEGLLVDDFGAASQRGDGDMCRPIVRAASQGILQSPWRCECIRRRARERQRRIYGLARPGSQPPLEATIFCSPSAV